MALARLVVIEGPDLGCEFEIPMRGGGIGRGEGNVVQLSDLAVSRSHCTLALKRGRLAIVDDGSRNRTLVNGKPITTHVLEQGDEISVGKTRLAFLPSEGGVAVMRQALPSRVTMEIGSGELLRAATAGLPGLTGASPAAGIEGRARRHLASLANLGAGFADVKDREALSQAACQATLSALAADRAFVTFPDHSGRMVPIAAAVVPGDPEGTQLSLPREVLDKVVAEGKAIALGAGAGAGNAAQPGSTWGQGSVSSAGPAQRSAVAAPLLGFPDERTSGLLYADRRAGPSWDQVDVMAVGCVAHLVSAALTAVETRNALARENLALEESLGGGGRRLVGSSPAAQALLAFVAKVGPSDATVLLTGESGSGKEMVAHAIHRASRRSRGPFIAVNCAAMTETLIESELFGHEKGAFTGATERKLGRFELADKGTLFLDEVGELPLNCQTKFLRVLEEQLFERVGGTRSISVDVRVIAATNRNLADMVRTGHFREDLYYRLSVIHNVVPPLRQRAADIPELADHFLHMLRSQVARRVTGFTDDAMRAMVAHPWPGNVRELRNAIERAIVLGEGAAIRLQDLPPNLGGSGLPAGHGAGAGSAAQPGTMWGQAAPPVVVAPAAVPAQPAVPPTPNLGTPPAYYAPTPPPMPPAPAEPVARSLRELEREGIVAALRATGGNKAQAAAILEIDRSTLYKKIKDYGIDA